MRRRDLQPLPLLYVSGQQVNAVIPYGIQTNAQHQVVVRRGGKLLGTGEYHGGDGSGGPGLPLSRVVTPVEARIGGRDAAVQFAGLAPGFVGLYQVNVEVPAGVEPGPAATLVLLQNGAPSNTVTLAVR